MRVTLCLGLLVLAACGGGNSGSVSGGESGSGGPPAIGSHVPRAVALLAVRQAGCAACHSVGDAVAQDSSSVAATLRPVRARPLEKLATSVDIEKGKPGLESHFAGDQSSDVLAWLGSLAKPRSLEAKQIATGMIARGGELVAELACGACHTPSELDLSSDSDHTTLAAFLREPQKRYPQLAHVPLDRAEADQIAAWLLRQQKQQGKAAPGFAYACYERKIDSGDWPDVSALEPTAKGLVDKIDITCATRKRNYALEFWATLDVPSSGEWQFATLSDDGSWLWIDGKRVVANGGIKPAKRKSGSITLDKGPHELRVAYTQGGGGAELKVLWSGPGLHEQQIPANRANATVLQLVPPGVLSGSAPTAVAEDAVARGRKAARERRCDACHQVDDALFAALPVPDVTPRPWGDLADAGASGGACAMPAGPGIYEEVGALPEELDPRTQLRIALGADGCLSCHVRDGEGGLPMAVRKELTEREDIGEEGMVPPDLSSVGRRLRPAWIERVVKHGHKARPYVAMRMPRYGAEKARKYAELFAQCDADGLVDEEPVFDAEAVELGRSLAGTGGRNCISCHTMSGHAALGPQGMDLSLQHERVRPGWFRDWLQMPMELRPNTRMPSLWLGGGDQDLVEIDAIRTWMSLGEAAPLPKGVQVDKSSLVLEPIDRPVLHGAFLKDVSARCLAVGTPSRTHYAFDLEKPRLVWIWRGAFLDARGTWHGRAGKLVEPLGKDWVVVEDFQLDGEHERKLVGQQRTDDGYPVLRVGFGDARYLDSLRPRLVAGGSELVRTIRCEVGELALTFAGVDGVRTKISGGTAHPSSANLYYLTPGQQLKVVYQW